MHFFHLSVKLLSAGIFQIDGVKVYYELIKFLKDQILE